MPEPRFPDLLGIGTQRSGTTWLWKNLTHCPSLYVPPFKEIHYLDMRGQIPSPGQQQFRASQLQDVLHAIQNGAPNDQALVQWFGRFALAKRNDDAWYASLFTDAEAHQLAIDFTPSYCRMTPDQIARVVTLIPHVRVILMLRDPIDRAWSQMHLNLRLKRQPPLQTPGEFQRWCQSPEVSGYQQYADILERWTAAIGRERIFIGFYEELQTQPAALLERLLQWLGVPFEPGQFGDSIHAVYNKTTSRVIPEDFARAAAPAMLPGLLPLTRHLDGPPVAWLDRCKRLMGIPV